MLFLLIEILVVVDAKHKILRLHKFSKAAKKWLLMHLLEFARHPGCGQL